MVICRTLCQHRTVRGMVIFFLLLTTFLLYYFATGRQTGSLSFLSQTKMTIPRPHSSHTVLDWSKSSPHRPPKRKNRKRQRDEPFGDNEGLQKAYRRSPCSGLQNKFVGSDPLFPPCRPSLPPGVATWGEYPYLGPFNFTKKSKSPCFYDKGGQLRCLPYFFLAGFSKCGTSDLFSRLSSHPQVQYGTKEFAWFSRWRFPQYVRYHTQNFSEYLDGFSNLSQIVSKDMASARYSNVIMGDYSVMAINEVFEWPQLSGNEGCSEPRVVNANHIRHLNPDVRVIIIMRHPVQRLYSRFLFDYRRRTLRDYRRERKISIRLRTPETFHEYVVDGLQQYEACFSRFSLRHCVYNRSLWESVHGLKIQDSMYAVLVEDWLRVIPRDQMLFLRSEDFKADVTGTLRMVFRFLALDPLSDKEMAAIVRAKFQTRNTRPVGPMLNQTRELLENFFQPFRRRLARLLKDPKFLWEDV